MSRKWDKVWYNFNTMKQKIANYTVIITKEKRSGTSETCYTAFVPVLGIATEADSLEGAQKAVHALVQFHVESLAEEGEEVPVESTESFITKSHTILPLGIKISHA